LKYITCGTLEESDISTLDGNQIVKFQFIQTLLCQ
jgi:hypothetical protein